MNTKQLLIPCSFLLIIIFNSCKKEIISQDENLGIEEKVTIWLKSKKSNFKTNVAKTTSTLIDKNTNIDLLNENLDFQGATTTSLDKQRDLLVISIKEDLKIKKHLNKNSTLTLFLFTDKSGKILDGGINYYIPEDGVHRGNFNAISMKDMLLQLKPMKDGVYKYLKVNGTLLSQVEFKKGKVSSIGLIRKKDKSGERIQRTTTCIAWYLVTTYYYSDGTTVTTEEFLGTTCDNCDGSDYESQCGDVDDTESSDPNGSGSSGGSDYIDESEAIKEELEEELTISTESVPTYGPSESGTISTTWHALVNIFYVTKSGVVFVTKVEPQKPFPAPVLVPFWSNSYGDMYCQFSCGTWNKDSVRITPRSFQVTWWWDELRTYYRLDNTSLGTLTFPNKTASKIVSK